MSLWLCLHFPRLPLECLSHRQEHPAIVIERQRVTVANDVALAAGVKPEQSSATVRTLVDSPDLQIFERNHAQEARALAQLECWAYGITPTLERWQETGLQLEIGRCLKLHGGLEKLLGDVQAYLLQRGFTAKAGLAPNRLAAELLGYWEDDPLMGVYQDLRQRMTDIPLTLLHKALGGEFSDALARLGKAGIGTLGELIEMPSSALGRRCGPTFQNWIGKVIASHDTAARDFQPPHHFHDRLWFGFEIRNQVELQPAMQQLLQALTRFSRTAQHQPSHIEWQMLRLHGNTEAFEVRSSEAHDDPELWFELSRLNLEQRTLGADIEGLALHVHQFHARQAAVSDLFGDTHNREPLHSLVDRLRSRLGLQAVNTIALREAHLPEYSQYLSQDTVSLQLPLTGQAQRPFWLFSEPHPVRLENNVLHWNGPLVLLLGPERLEDNWWQQPASRDYYVAQTAAGQPIWLFQDRYSKQWYVQGILP